MTSAADIEAIAAGLSEAPLCLGSGLLGATASGPYAHTLIEEARLLMIERRILRIEMACRRAGIEVEAPPLPPATPSDTGED